MMDAKADDKLHPAPSEPRTPLLVTKSAVIGLLRQLIDSLDDPFTEEELLELDVIRAELKLAAHRSKLKRFATFPTKMSNVG